MELEIAFTAYARAAFPAAVEPPVLAGVGADEVFDGLGVALRDVAEGIGLRLPVLRMDDVLGGDFEFERFSGAAGVRCVTIATKTT